MRWALHALLLIATACTPAQADIPGWTSGGTSSGGGTTVSYGTYATLAAAASSCTTGDLGKPTDSPTELRCESDGVWVRYFQDRPCVAPPSSGWTAYNSGAVTANSDGSRTLVLPAEVFAGNGLRGEYRAVPSDVSTTPYDVEVVLLAGWTGTSANVGLIMAGHTDGTGVAVVFAGSGNGLAVGRWSAATTFVANDHAITADPVFPAWWKFGENATNRTYFIGDSWGNYDDFGGGDGRTVTFTATSNFWGGVSGDVDSTLTVTLMCWDDGS